MKQPRAVVFDPPIRLAQGGSVRVQLTDDGTIDWVLVVRYWKP